MGEPRMRRSSQVSLLFLSAFAAAVAAGCGNDQDGDWVEAKRCVDNNKVVVEDRLCDEQARSGSYHGGGYHHYYYGGRGYYPGETVSGGSSTPQSGVRYASPSHITRGGFGSTGKAFVSYSGASGG